MPARYCWTCGLPLIDGYCGACGGDPAICTCEEKRTPAAKADFVRTLRGLPPEIKEKLKEMKPVERADFIWSEAEALL